MIQISVPQTFIHERSYVIDILLNECIGIEYKIEINPGLKDYKMCLPNGNDIIIEDHFFSVSQESTGYLDIKSLPSKIEYMQNRFLTEDDLPVIYGTDHCQVLERGNYIQVVCGNDIFAGAFFMLSRWEEFVVQEKDEYGRFDEKQSLAYRAGFHQRAIVNEMAEFLWNILIYCGHPDNRRKRQYQVKPTHDVDYFSRFTGIFSMLRTIGGDIFVRRNPGMSLKTIKDYLIIVSNKSNDPYNTYDYLMNISDNYGLVSTFYFIPAISKEFGSNYLLENMEVKEMIGKISERGHRIGIHGQFESYKYQTAYNAGYVRLKTIYNQLNEGRQHYLRFENPVSWQIWNDCGIETDSTLGFTSDVGFRCGICHEFSVFNILTRRKLDLKELPLIVMDTALQKKHGHAEKIFEEIIRLSGICKKYNGTFVLLWHNSSFNIPPWNKISSIYPEIINSVR
ncbi:MAG: polysaccharide deacetylase family protein [Bacteroidia bacterium]|nr:polysaccharide deacetylase family protein [Bacteroidia bacterium]